MDYTPSPDQTQYVAHDGHCANGDRQPDHEEDAVPCAPPALAGSPFTTSAIVISAAGRDDEMRRAAADYRRRGFGIVWLRPGEKRPQRNGWTLASQEVDHYTPGGNIGLLCGRLSHDLVCVDLDSPDALRLADGILPPTAMIDGRASKPRSHRWYRVTDIQPEFTSTAAGGIGGPSIKHLKHEVSGGSLIDFLGTGAHAVVPPSSHDSGEIRIWEATGDPAVLPMVTLWEAVTRLAEACGYQRPEARATTKSTNHIPCAPPSAPSAELERAMAECAIPMMTRIRRASAYMATVGASISGAGGHDAAFRAARILVNDFLIPPDLAWPHMVEFNARCQPRWSEEELRHKLHNAQRHVDSAYPPGCKLSGCNHGNGQADNDHDAEAYNDPERLARSFISTVIWRTWRQEHWRYDGTRYEVVPANELKLLIRRYIKKQFDAYHEQLQVAAAARAGARGGAVRRDFRPPPVPQISTRLVDNVKQAFECLTLLPGTVPQPSMLPEGKNGNLIALKNGLLVPENRSIYAHTPNWFSPICLPYSYDLTARCPRWLQVLERCLEGDVERIALLQEWFGYHLVSDTGEQKFMILFGEGANGKSVVFAALEAMLGPRNVSHLGLEKFASEFELVSTLGKMANICAEVGDLDKTAEGVLKSFTSGDVMHFNRKFISPIEAVPTARLTLATNNPPRFSDKSRGVWRRLELVPFRVEISEMERQKGMDKVSWWEQSGELPGILNWALDGLVRLRARGFTVSAVCRAALDEHRLESNQARLFLTEHFRFDATLPESIGIKVPEMYRDYKDWYEASNGGIKQCLSSVAFGKELRRAFPRAEIKNHRWGLEGQFKTIFGLTQIPVPPLPRSTSHRG